MEQASPSLAQSIKSFTCPNCGGSVALRAVGISVSAICQYCGSTIDIANENLKIIQRAHSAHIRKFPLDLGQRGYLFGNEWEVIGIQERSVLKDEYAWREYLLFNPWQGFRFLVESDGHWTFVAMLRQAINDDHTPRLDGISYKIFDSTQARTTYVIGEFYWRVQIGETADLVDYIAPPYILSREQGKEDIIWSQGIYVEPDEVMTAFNGNPEFWPLRNGIAPNQPYSERGAIKKIWMLSAVFAILLYMTQIITGQSSHETLFDAVLTATPNQTMPSTLSSSITLKDEVNAVGVHMFSDLKNQWIDVDLELVNLDTGESFEAYNELSHYAGYDEDGYWSEANNNIDDLLSPIPAGRYKLLATTDTGKPPQNVTPSYHLVLNTGEPIFSNFLITLIAMLLFPITKTLQSANFEKKRWEGIASDSINNEGEDV